MLNARYFEAGLLYENSDKGWKNMLVLLIRLGKHKLLPKKAGFFKHKVCGHPENICEVVFAGVGEQIFFIL